MLAQADDPTTRKIALDIVKFAQTMPPVKTRHEERLEAARRATGGGKFQGGARAWQGAKAGAGAGRGASEIT
ncbi:MAG: hypothetical protein LBJ59_07340 [Zoogloeaceae bacterium]|jgi:hypothetical protein|nr:hypothetical protein [Zoogloeaceae bacterium]